MKLSKIILSTFGALSFSASFSQIHVLNNGKTGLGVTTPIEMLHVKGNSIFTSSTSYPSSSPFIRGGNSFSSSSSPGYTWWNDDQTGIYHPAGGQIGFSSQGNYRMIIKYNSVLFQSYSDWAPAATINASHTNAVGYNMKYFGVDKFFVHGSGYIYSQGQYIGSDINLKKDITPIKSSDALDKVLKLKGVSYKYKLVEGAKPSFLNETKQIGFIAQEVEKVVPEVVLTTEDGVKAVAYQNMVALLVEAFEEQNNEIKRLNNKIEKLELETYSSIDSKDLGYLVQNAPNPFKESTEIRYKVNKNNFETGIIAFFDMNGTLVKEYKVSQENEGVLVIKGDSFVPGMYLYTLIIDGQDIDTKRMILLD